MKNIKKLLIVTNIPTPYRSAFFNILNKECKKKHIELKVLFCAKSEPRRHWVFDESEIEYDYKFLHGWSPTIKGISFHVNPSIKKEVFKYNPDIILCAGSWNMPSLVFLLSNKFLRKRVIFWCEGHDDAERYSSGLIPVLRGKILNSIQMFAVPNLKSQQWIEKQVRVEPKKRFFMLANSIDEEFFDISFRVDKSKYLIKHGIEKNSKVFLQVSMLEDRKGVLELARSFLNVSNSTNSVLILLGTGSLYTELNNLAQKFPSKLYLLGHVDAIEVRNWLSIADFFVLNTKLDPNPLTPIEASFMGTPLILSKLAGNSQDLCKKSTGILIENPCAPDDALKRAQSMTFEEIKSLGEKARLNALDNFKRTEIASYFIEQILKK